MADKRNYLIVALSPSAIVANLEDNKASKLELFVQRSPIVIGNRISESWLRENGEGYSRSLPELSRYFREIYWLGADFYRELSNTGDLLFDERLITKYECEGCDRIYEESPLFRLVITNPSSRMLTEVEVDYFCKECDEIVFGHTANIDHAKKIVGEKGISCIRFDGSGDFIRPTREMIEDELKIATEQAKEDGKDNSFLNSLALKQAEHWSEKIGYDIAGRIKQIKDIYRLERKSKHSKNRVGVF